MPVMSREKNAELLKELNYRYLVLIDSLTPRDLKTSKEGTGIKWKWSDPDKMCATKGDPMQIRLAAADFTSILGEIKKLK